MEELENIRKLYAESEKRRHGDIRSLHEAGRQPESRSNVNELLETARGAMESIRLYASGKDPEFSYEGAPHFGFRAGLSRQDTPEERTGFLDRWVGKGGWTQDRFGNYALTPQGQSKIGMQPSDRPVAIDEKGLPTRYDIADISGESPAVAGALFGAGMGAVAGGVGAAPGAVLGAMFGKSVGEATEGLAGENIQSQLDVGKDIAREGVLAGVGEGITQGMYKLGRRVMAPQAHHMTPESRAIVREAKDIGVTPSVQQTLGTTGAPLLSRYQSVVNKIMGDPLLKKNEEQLGREIWRLKTVGAKGGPEKAGELVKHSLFRGKKMVSRWAKIAYNKIDSMAQDAGGNRIVPTKRLQLEAQRIIDNAPKTKNGKLIGDYGYIKTLADVEDWITMPQLRALRGEIYKRKTPMFFPTLDQKHIGELYGTTRAMFDDAADAAWTPELGGVIKEINKKYFKMRDQFDLAEINALVRQKGEMGAVLPEKVVSRLFKPGETTNLKAIMPFLPEKTRKIMRREAMEEILKAAVKRSDNPLEQVFTGKQLLNTLDDFGEPTLKAMFGSEKTNQLYRLGKVASLSTLKMTQAGGIVAASIALHPLRNLGRLLGMSVMAKVMNSPKGIEWLTEGLKIPPRIPGEAMKPRVLGAAVRGGHSATTALTRLSAQIAMLTDETLKEHKISDDIAQEPKQRTSPHYVSPDVSAFDESRDVGSITAMPTRPAFPQSGGEFVPARQPPMTGSRWSEEHQDWFMQDRNSPSGWSRVVQ